MYAHLETINVKVGDVVSEGEIIGGVGNTGTSAGYHLHLGIHDSNKTWQDPAKVDYDSLPSLTTAPSRPGDVNAPDTSGLNASPLGQQLGINAASPSSNWNFSNLNIGALSQPAASVTPPTADDFRAAPKLPAAADIATPAKTPEPTINVTLPNNNRDRQDDSNSSSTSKNTSYNSQNNRDRQNDSGSSSSSSSTSSSNNSYNSNYNRDRQENSGGGSSRDTGNSSSSGRTSQASRNGFPVLMDLDNNGISVKALSSSDTYFDMAGDGQQHRTAWAGKGDGVLAIDANGDGTIDQQNEIVFTAWDPAARTDFEALKNIFDTNHNGKLDAGDARFAQFRVVVDGQVKTLAQLGIVSIDLTSNRTAFQFSDGSSIDGVASFTRADGSKGIAADATLASEASGGTVTRVVTDNADGSTTTKTTAKDASGKITAITTKTVSAGIAIASEVGTTSREAIASNNNNNTDTLAFDDDGDGVNDRDGDFGKVRPPLLPRMHRLQKRRLIASRATRSICQHRLKTSSQVWRKYQHEFQNKITKSQLRHP